MHALHTANDIVNVCDPFEMATYPHQLAVLCMSVIYDTYNTTFLLCMPDSVVGQQYIHESYYCSTSHVRFLFD